MGITALNYLTHNSHLFDEKNPHQEPETEELNSVSLRHGIF
jgi:hypothetical protein